MSPIGPGSRVIWAGMRATVVSQRMAGPNFVTVAAFCIRVDGREKTVVVAPDQVVAPEGEDPPARVLERIRLELIAQAERDCAAWSQYRGHWDDWKLGWATREVKTKLGVACRAGETVLFIERYASPGELVFYSKLNRIDTVVDAMTIKEIE